MVAVTWTLFDLFVADLNGAEARATSPSWVSAQDIPFRRAMDRLGVGPST